jgi:FAD/FMN-containing dehydrogenase
VLSTLRRRLLQAGFAAPLVAGLARVAHTAAPASARIRPTDADWPGPADWKQLQGQLSGSLIAVRSPWPECMRNPLAPACTELFRQAKNPYFLGDEVALTQTLGWVNAWTCASSVHAIRVRNTADVVAAVNFARTRNLRLVVKGGGHSYQGTSNAPDSLLMWTRDMNDVTLHENWVARGCEGQAAPQRVASIGAGALWAHAYDAVTTRGGGYVQGGGCMTVGVAGLVQSGGFGSFSKAFGLAASSLLEAEVVTADGSVRIANACTNPNLFWGLKGGGGGGLGVVTRLTLRVHALPETFGAVNFTVRAKSDAAFRRLIAMVTRFYADALMNPHWGEQIRLRPGNLLNVAMVFQGLARNQAVATWQPFFDAVEKEAENFSVDFAPFKVVATSARSFWSPTLIKRALGFIRRDDRPGAPEGNVFWPGDQGQAGQVLHGYQSTWLPAALLQPANHGVLCDALFAATRHWGVSLHVNKGLAGAPAEVITAAHNTAMNPAVLDAFALAISAAGEQPVYPGVAGHEPDVALAHQHAQSIRSAMGELRKLVPRWGSYVGESDYFEPDWQHAFWGSNHERLAAVKQKYDPDGLFFVHHGVGSEQWSSDGFTRVRA